MKKSKQRHQEVPSIHDEEREVPGNLLLVPRLLLKQTKRFRRGRIPAGIKGGVPSGQLSVHIRKEEDLRNFMLLKNNKQRLLRIWWYRSCGSGFRVMEDKPAGRL